MKSLPVSRKKSSQTRDFSTSRKGHLQTFPSISENSLQHLYTPITEYTPFHLTASHQEALKTTLTVANVSVKTTTSLNKCFPMKNTTERAQQLPHRRRSYEKGKNHAVKNRANTSPNNSVNLQLPNLNAKKSDPNKLKSLVSGVYFHLLKQEWRAVIGHGSRRQQKTFSVRKYGFDRAKYFAEYFRTQFELSNTPRECHVKTAHQPITKIKQYPSSESECLMYSQAKRYRSSLDFPHPPSVLTQAKNKETVVELQKKNISTELAYDRERVNQTNRAIMPNTSHVNHSSDVFCHTFSHSIPEYLVSYIFSGIELQQLLVESLSLPPLIMSKLCLKTGLFLPCLSKGMEELNKKNITTAFDFLGKKQNTAASNPIRNSTFSTILSDLILQICKDIAQNNLQTNTMGANPYQKIQRGPLSENRKNCTSSITQHFRTVDKNLMQLRFSI